MWRPGAGRAGGYVAGVTTFTGPPGGGDAWSAQPRALIVTIYGLYAREAGGWLSVASLIRLMAELGSDEPAGRSSISRLQRHRGPYQAFLDDAEPVLARWDSARAARAGLAGEAFASYTRALTAWRRLPFLDPGLPAELLPGGWNGLQAAAAFGALRERLAGPARAHALAVIGRPGQGMTA